MTATNRSRARIAPLLFLFFILVTPFSVSLASGETYSLGAYPASSKFRQDDHNGYAHHDDHSGHFDNKNQRWEWRGPHKGCRVKGKHYHPTSPNSSDISQALDCSKAIANPSVLWPANHKLSDVDIVGLTTSDGSFPDILVRCIYQDEPLNGIGDGNTDFDAFVSSQGQIRLRKERLGKKSGQGNGRVYHVEFEARDIGAQQSCRGSVAVEVPHRWWGKAKDDGYRYVSFDNGFDCGGDTNQAPFISSDPVTTSPEGSVYEYAVVAEDPEAQTLGYRLLEAPADMNISPSGLVTWQPQLGEAGSYLVVIEVNDGENSIEQRYTLIISPRDNNAPTFLTSPITEAIEEQAYTYQVGAVDPENDALGFSLVTAPQGMLISLDGLLTWTPNEGEAGEHSVIVEVIDILGAAATQSFVLSVAPKPNGAPEILSTPPSEIREAELFHYEILAIDPEGDALTYRLINSPDDLTLTNNVIEWTPTYDDAGEHAIELAVSDSDGAVATQAFLLNVINVNREPIFISVPNLLVNENSVYQYTPEAIDDDGDPVVFSLQSAPDGMRLYADGSIEWMPGYDAAGSYEIVIAANDEQGTSVTQVFTLAVVDVNRDPQIISLPNLSAIENMPYSYQVEAMDDDEQLLTYALLESPEGMTISDTGLIEWLPPFDTTDLVSDVFVEVAVSDGLVSITQQFDLRVENTNRIPRAIDQAVVIDEDTPVQFRLNAEDDDGNALSFLIVDAPTNGSVLLNGDQVEYRPNINFYGVDEFSFVASDDSDNSQPAIVTITVTAVNDIPIISLSPITSAKENAPYTIDVDASDAENDLLYFSLLEAPSGMTIDSATGVINWFPSYDQAGDIAVTVAVTDTSGAMDAVSFTVTVLNTNRPPMAQSLDVEVSQQGEVINLMASDPDGDLLQFTVYSPPSNGSVVIDNGSAIYAPNAGYTGVDNFAYVANDGEMNSAPAVVHITVVNTNQPPEIVSNPNLFAYIGETYQYQIEAFDPDSDPLTFSLVGGPTGMSLDESSGLLRWNVTPTASNEHRIEVEVNDKSGNQAFQSFTLQSIDTGSEQDQEYWLLFNDAPMNSSADGPIGDVYVMLRSESEASGQVEIPRLGVSIPFTVIPNEFTRIDLTAYREQLVTDHGRDVNGGNNAVRVISDTNVSVYAFNHVNASLDATPVLPISSLGDEYILVSHGDGDDYYGSGQFGVVATQDDTQIIYTFPADTTIFGQDLTFKAGDSYTVSLEQGQTHGFSFLDLHGGTGIEITSNHPIALFGGAQCNYVPTQGYQFCDHLFEQIAPIHYWSTEYIAAPFSIGSNAIGDVFRFVAAFDDTEVKVNGIVQAQLNRGEWLQDTFKAPIVIKANHPIGVVQIEASQSFETANPNLSHDPFAVMLYGSEHYSPSSEIVTASHIYAVQGFEAFTKSYISVIATDYALESLMLNGDVVDTSNFIDVPQTNYMTGQLLVEPGRVYNLTAEDPIHSVVHGYMTWGGYGYPSAPRMPVLSPNTQLSIDALSSSSIAEIGEQHCIEVTLEDNGLPVRNVRVDFSISGRHQRLSHVVTNGDGIANYCYAGNTSGVDEIAINAMQLSASVAVEWVTTTGSGATPPKALDTSLPSIAVNEPFNYQLAFYDPDLNSEVSFWLVDAPNNLTLTQQGALNWLPEESQLGSHTVIIKVEDETGLSSSTSLSIDVWKPNLPPLVVDNEIITLPSNRPNFEAPFDVLDPEDDPVEMRLLDAPEGISVSPLFTAAELPPHLAEFSQPLFFADNLADTLIGLHEVTLELRDVRGGIATVPVQLNIVANREPTDIQLPQNRDLLSLHFWGSGIVAEDPDGDRGTYSLVSGPAGMYINPYGSLGWTPSENQLGDFDVIVRFDDGYGGVIQGEFSINVQPNNAPYFTTTPKTTAYVNELYRYDVATVDPDNDGRTLSIVSAPEGFYLPGTVSASTFFWTPTVEQLGIHPVEVRIEDSYGGFATQAFQLLVVDDSDPVNPDNHLPIIESTPSELVAINAAYQYTVKASDRDGDTLAYQLAQSPSGMVITADGLLIWDTSSVAVGNYVVEISVSDGLSNATQIFSIEVIDDTGGSNTLSLINKPLTEAFIGESYRYITSGIAENGDEVTIALISAPAGMIITADTPAQGLYQLDWVPNEANCQHDTILELSDSAGNNQQVTFTIDVYDAPKRLNRFQCSRDTDFCPTR